MNLPQVLGGRLGPSRPIYFLADRQVDLWVYFCRLSVSNACIVAKL